MGSHNNTTTPGARSYSSNHPVLNFINLISKVSGWTAAFMLVVAVAVTCQMIFVRFVLNASTAWQTEAVIYLVIGATLIGLAYVQSLRGHVNVDAIPLILPQKARFFMAILSLTATAVIIGMILFYGSEYWYLTYKKGWTSETVNETPLWIPYLSIPLGFGLYLLQILSDLTAVILKLDTPFDLEEK